MIAMSAGNHAQGVAYHAQRLGIPATIVMPVNTPTVKVEHTRRHGAEVILTGETVEEADGLRPRARRASTASRFVHPYDDPLVIAGQGTLALEMLGAAPETRYADRADRRRRAHLRHRRRGQGAEARHRRLIGVETVLYPSMYNAIKGTQLPMRGDTLAEGIAVKAPGAHHARRSCASWSTTSCW